MSTNPHTGAKLQTGVPSNEYLANYDLIFKKKNHWDICPLCGGEADNGYDRSYPEPNAYICKACTKEALE
jgi:hypothetical protein